MNHDPGDDNYPSLGLRTCLSGFKQGPGHNFDFGAGFDLRHIYVDV